MITLRLSVIGLLLICNGIRTQDTQNYRLPITVLPINYDIELTPYFTSEPGKDAFTFDGVTRITLSTTLANVNEIVLHANSLTWLTEPTVINTVTQTPVVLTGFNNAAPTHKWTISLATPLTANQNYLVTFTYTGILSNDMYGFYRSSYVENGITKWLASTQFQPTSARRAFPCFDEPSFKATFDIKINRLSSFQPSIGNTRIAETDVNIVAPRIQERFARTPIMSTYLVAFVVSEFQTRQSGDFFVAARPDAFDQTLYAVDVGIRMLASFDNFMAYPYSEVPEMDKMHMLAIPDFSAGAMENWGLLTYRETGLLYDPVGSTALNQQRIAAVIAHEQAHMWFGNLVTCEWWSYTWINEGFARFFQYFETGRVEPSWDMELQFVVEQIHTAMAVDSLENSRSMTSDVYSPAEVSGNFDNISYNKGAAVLRMIQHLIGATNFQAALRVFLRSNAFSTSTPEKLYAALLAQSPTTDIAAIMNSWTTQSGYPVVFVHRDDDLRTLHVSQERFLLRNRNHTDQTTWVIPLNYATSSGPNFQATNVMRTMLQTERDITIELTADAEWVIFNKQQTGFYRVNYDNETWTNIATALKTNQHSGIPILNRAQIVDDVLNLARADHLDYWQAMNVIQYLENEENYAPWLAAFNNLLYISRRMTGEDLDLYKSYFQNLTQNIYEKLEFNPTNPGSRIDIYNRANVLNYLCKYGHEECISAAQEEFVRFRATDGYIVPANIRAVVYCTGLAEGNASDWNFLWNRYLNENLAAEQNLILSILGCTKSQTELTTYMNFILTDAIRLQDKGAAFTATFNEQIENVPIVFNFVTANFQQIANALGGIGSVATILSNLAVRFSTQAQIDLLQTFYTQNSAAFGTSQTIPNAIRDARLDLEWAEEHIPTIVDYINVGTPMFTISLLLMIMPFLTFFY